MEGAPIDYTFWLAGDTPDTMIGGMMELTKEAADMGAPPNWLAYVEGPDTNAAVEQTVKLGGKVIVPAKSVDREIVCGVADQRLGAGELLPTAWPSDWIGGGG